MLRSFVIPGLVTLLVGCGGETAADSDDGSGGAIATGGTTATGGSGSGGAAGAPAGGGAAGSATGGAGGAECVQVGDGWPSDLDPTCADLSVLAIDSPSVTGDGSVSAGDAFDLKVVLREVAGVGFGWYPGVTFESNHPGVSISGPEWFYGIFGCTSYDVGAQGKVDGSVKSGTVVEVTARVAMLNEDCPSAPSIKIQLTVK